MPDKERVFPTITADGSHTLFFPEINEHYHSVNGAKQESLHVYIEAGFNRCPKETVRVLEMGFGTGLNALLTALESQKRNIRTTYITLEKYPVSPAIIRQLNYGEIDENLFRRIHAAEWETVLPLTPFFTLQKIRCDFNTYPYSDRYDVVYYDAFAPGKQPEVWSQELFDKLFRALNPGGVLTTYCAQGHVRRMLQRAGFTVERIPGPPGKREMLRAWNIDKSSYLCPCFY
ncbi:MAG: tRNA (5-methylaminomethyl-2-thiouridine)(34)-methyltransferase MnmD [Dysgonamonadaceae bacterium]|jgi:tRNA U34 5-methylaminomethyl-2-thiouridine-forming methyltransferase MnmC|nr:tRNA (5-methylaminomethyl-2-thiouridine)(34)-methyltransferase MnmD [Dysgonamonadaceae bacterium]